VVFIALYIVCTLLVLPKAILSIAAGVTYGFLPGLVVVLIGATAGACAAFVLGRWLGRDAVERFAGTHLNQMDRVVQRYGFGGLILARLIPIVPFTATNYVAGLTSLRLPSFAIGTFVGIIPGTSAYVALGAFGVSPWSWEFVVAVAVFAIVTVAGMIAVRRMRSTGALDETLAE